MGAVPFTVVFLCALVASSSVQLGDGGTVCSDTSDVSMCDRCVASASSTGIDAQDKRAVAGAIIECAKTQASQLLLNSTAAAEDNGGCVNATRSFASLLDEASRLWSAQQEKPAVQSLELAVEATLVVVAECNIEDLAPLTNLDLLLADLVQIFRPVEASSTAVFVAAEPLIYSISLLSLIMFLFLF